MLKEDKLESKIQKEIRRRAFNLADRRARDKDTRREFELKMDALGEVTGLERSELEKIAAEVRSSFERPRRDYFSIKSQVVVVFGSIGAVCLTFYLFFRWIF